MNNQLESYWFRRDAVAELFTGFPYSGKERESTISAWAHSNLSIEEIKFLLNNADKKEIEDIKNKKDLRLAMEKEQLREGKEKKSNFNYNFELEENFNFNLRSGPGVLTK